MPMSLKAELKLHGATITDGDFNELLSDLHTSLHPSWTVEELLYHPATATEFCDRVRGKAGDKLPDDMILRRLQNLRKSGDALALRTRQTTATRPKAKPAKKAKGRKAGM